MAKLTENITLFIIGTYLLLPVSWNILYLLVDIFTETSYLELVIFMKIFISMFGLSIVFLSVADINKNLKEKYLSF